MGVLVVLIVTSCEKRQPQFREILFENGRQALGSDSESERISGAGRLGTACVDYDHEPSCNVLRVALYWGGRQTIEAIVDGAYATLAGYLPIGGWDVAYATVTTTERRRKVLWVLRNLPPSPHLVHLFIGELRRPDARADDEASRGCKRIALDYLASLADRDLEQFIVPLLGDPDPDLRARAAEILGTAERVEIDRLDELLDRADDGIASTELASQVRQTRWMQAELAGLSEERAIARMWSDSERFELVSRRRIACRSPHVLADLIAMANGSEPAYEAREWLERMKAYASSGDESRQAPDARESQKGHGSSARESPQERAEQVQRELREAHGSSARESRQARDARVAREARELEDARLAQESQARTTAQNARAARQALQDRAIYCEPGKLAN